MININTLAHGTADIGNGVLRIIVGVNHKQYSVTQVHEEKQNGKHH